MTERRPALWSGGAGDDMSAGSGELEIMTPRVGTCSSWRNERRFERRRSLVESARGGGGYLVARVSKRERKMRLPVLVSAVVDSADVTGSENVLEPSTSAPGLPGAGALDEFGRIPFIDTFLNIFPHFLDDSTGSAMVGEVGAVEGLDEEGRSDW